MSITSDEELQALRAAGEVVREVLDVMKGAVRPGITTAQLDAIGGEVMRRNGARSAPVAVYGFPGHACISVNDEIVHGIPGKRTLRDGDLVKLDVTVEKDGFMADAAITVAVGEISATARRLARCAEQAFGAAMKVARAGARVMDIGAAVEREVERQGFSVVRELTGHGIGRTIHEAPCVPNYRDPSARDLLTEGLVITVEPIISAGNGRAYTAGDGWTVKTTDRQLAAHFEHTLVITSGEPVLLTAGA